jgi:cysteine sulfinate desulfinase/cysteine desulfurase-like protein
VGQQRDGVIFPIEKIAALAKKPARDAHRRVQVAGSFHRRQKGAGDMLSLSGTSSTRRKDRHLLSAPGTRLKTFMLGGHQEKRAPRGTENVPTSSGSAKRRNWRATWTRRAATDASRDNWRMAFGDVSRPRVNGDRATASNTSNMSFEYIEGEASSTT